MKYSIQQLINSPQQQKFLFFWGHQPSKSGEITSSCLSQWWESSFIENGVIYKTAEHWMMAQKALLFNDYTIYHKIGEVQTPGEAKKLGREVTGFIPKLWDQKKYEIVVRGNLLKFSQNEELKSFLLSTKNRVLVEASPVDQIWGIGMAADHPEVTTPYNWKGENLLGFALMEVRDLLTK